MLDDREIERRFDDLHEEGLLPYQLRGDAERRIESIHSTHDLADAVMRAGAGPDGCWQDTVARSAALIDAWIARRNRAIDTPEEES